MKKIFSIILSVLILTYYVPCINAEENINNIEKKPPTVYKLTLNDAITMALTDNAQIIANEHRQSANKINIKSTRITKNSLKNLALNVSNNFESFCMREGYYVDAAEMTYRLSVIEAEKIKATISYNVTEAYYNAVLMEKLINAAQNSYELAVNNYNIVNAQYNLGLVAKLDFESASLAVSSAKNTLDSYKLNRETAIENLKILLNKDDENCILTLTDEIETEEFTSDVSNDIISAKETRYDIISLKENKELASRYFELSKVLTIDSATYNLAYASLLEANYNYDNSVKLITLSIKNSYNNILTSKSSMDIARSVYETEFNKYNSNKVKYELGVISNNELTQSINSLHEAQVSYANAKLTYRMAIEKYKHEINTGL